MNKKNKKIIVNTLTFTRVLATISMPILFNYLSSTAFLLLIGGVFLTDALDGFLARRWEVSTIFGSWFDMGADKLLGGAILLALSFTYPIMLIPLAMEIVITGINLKSTFKGGLGASSKIGKGKMWVMGVSICSLLLIGASPELSTSISNIKIDTNFFNEIYNKVQDMFNLSDKNIISTLSNNLDNIINNIKELFVNVSQTVLKFAQNNKEVIENVAIPSAIVSETVTAADYLKKYEKIKENDPKFTKEDYIKYKEYIKSIMFDEKYYDETKDMELYKKLIPEEYQKEKIKKLTLNDKK